MNDVECKLDHLEDLVAGRAQWTCDERALYDDDVKLVGHKIDYLRDENLKLRDEKIKLLELTIIEQERNLHAERQPAMEALADMGRVILPSAQHYYRALFHPKYVRLSSSQNASSSASRPSTQQAQFANRVREFYNIDRSFCMVAGQIPSDRIGQHHSVKAAHLWDYRCRRALPAFLLASADIDDPRNGLPLCSDIEIAFDAGRVCFLYQPATRNVIFFVLDPDIMNKTASPSRSTVKDLHGTALQFSNERRPFIELLVYLAADSLAFASKKESKSANWLLPSELNQVRTFVDAAISSLDPDDRQPIATLIQEAGEL
ncbi:HNH nuclease domain-containing protein [Plasmodiophora brassicae]|uniref:HNH nuclease domain-containing protein n=1 Tax=Plasmodiophora brassicae TaxID=37360 RepID=A0A0G4IMG8_PLABS|nr:hypothetical protein PBRA_005112 [Plasmodiophora brassicae]